MSMFYLVLFLTDFLDCYKGEFAWLSNLTDSGYCWTPHTLDAIKWNK